MVGFRAWGGLVDNSERGESSAAPRGHKGSGLRVEGPA